MGSSQSIECKRLNTHYRPEKLTTLNDNLNTSDFDNQKIDEILVLNELAEMLIKVGYTWVEIPET